MKIHRVAFVKSAPRRGSGERVYQIAPRRVLCGRRHGYPLITEVGELSGGRVVLRAGRAGLSRGPAG